MVDAADIAHGPNQASPPHKQHPQQRGLRLELLGDKYMTELIIEFNLLSEANSRVLGLINAINANDKLENMVEALDGKIKALEKTV